MAEQVLTAKIIRVWYFQNSHRTSASDAAVSTLQSAGYTLSQLITD